MATKRMGMEESRSRLIPLTISEQTPIIRLKYKTLPVKKVRLSTNAITAPAAKSKLTDLRSSLLKQLFTQLAASGLTPHFGRISA